MKKIERLGVLPYYTVMEAEVKADAVYWPGGQ